MAERLVDVLNDNNTVLHTFPVTLGVAEAKLSDTKFEEKALSAAAHSQLVPTEELEKSFCPDAYQPEWRHDAVWR